jgi:hypothetical protein
MWSVAQTRTIFRDRTRHRPKLIFALQSSLLSFEFHWRNYIHLIGIAGAPEVESTNPIGVRIKFSMSHSLP